MSASGRLALTSPAPKRSGPATAWFVPFFFFFPPAPRGRDRGVSPLRARQARKTNEKQLQTADRSAPASMKNAANCVNQCELQDTLIIDVSNAHGGPGSLPGPRPAEGRLLPKAQARSRVKAGAPRTVPWFKSTAVSESDPSPRAGPVGVSRVLSPSRVSGRLAVGSPRPPFSVPLERGSPLFFPRRARARSLDLSSDETTP